MEKVIKIGDQSVRLNNNVSWTMIYRDQFGRDIIPVLMPMLIGAIDLAKGLLEEIGEVKAVTLEDVLRLAEGETLIDAAIHLSSLEFVDFVNITWAMAKAADDDVPDPITWLKEFETFPVDVIAPELAGLVLKGTMSSKNLEKLKRTVGDLQLTTEKSTSTTSSSQDSSEG